LNKLLRSKNKSSIIIFCRVLLPLLNIEVMPSTTNLPTLNVGIVLCHLLIIVRSTDNIEVVRTTKEASVKANNNNEWLNRKQIHNKHQLNSLRINRDGRVQQGMTNNQSYRLYMVQISIITQMDLRGKRPHINSLNQTTKEILEKISNKWKKFIMHSRLLCTEPFLNQNSHS
jgi:hypothetical protein